ncbi:hypothetical protein C1646_699605 [Rhizophagus diaphanus]|nr:hypothetical protein C1646_699605 [Rhizophagus diaphanus] [Rhizophagus sp. MUCL 43196]
MVKELNKGLPRRSMNCFFVFRHVVYLEVLDQGLIEEVKDGVFFTQVVSEMWKNKEDREKYKKLATEIKNLQNEYHKDKIYCKNKPAGPKIIQKNTTNQVTQQFIYNIDNLDFIYPNYGFPDQNINYHHPLDISLLARRTLIYIKFQLPMKHSIYKNRFSHTNFVRLNR